MKKLFTVDDFMVAIIAALGYGFGEIIAKLSGWPNSACMVASLVLGVALESIISGIVFSKAVQKKPMNRILTFALIFFVFIVAQTVAVWWMGKSLLSYVEEEFQYVVVIPVIGFVLNLLIRRYRIWKIRRRYGDGSEGYVIDMDEEDIEELNRPNERIQGEYDTDCAVKTRTGVYVGEKHKKITACTLYCVEARTIKHSIQKGGDTHKWYPLLFVCLISNKNPY